MNKLVREAIEAAGLADVLDSRVQGGPAGAAIDRLKQADLLVAGALADCIRAHDVGDEVRIHVVEPGAGRPPAAPPGDLERTAADFLRQVALARIMGSAGGHVRVDWTRCGFELAQVALWFGADELEGTMTTKRGLPIGDGELLGVGKKSRRELADLVKRRELAAYVRQSGRVPVFVGPGRGAGEGGEPRAPGNDQSAVDGRTARAEPCIPPAPSRVDEVS